MKRFITDCLLAACCWPPRWVRNRRCARQQLFGEIDAILADSSKITGFKSLKPIPHEVIGRAQVKRVPRGPDQGGDQAGRTARRGTDAQEVRLRPAGLRSEEDHRRSADRAGRGVLRLPQEAALRPGLELQRHAGDRAGPRTGARAGRSALQPDEVRGSRRGE